MKQKTQNDREKRKAELLENFNPSDMALAVNGLFGLPFVGKNADLADIVIVPVSWHVTCSSGTGTGENYKKIFEASQQVDLYDEFNPDVWKAGITTMKLDLDGESSVRALNKALRKSAEEYVDFIAKGQKLTKQWEESLDHINKTCEDVHKLVKKATLSVMEQGKMVGLLGGDHSTSLGMIQALAQLHPDGFSILHFDAHADLREAYEGFTYSHASIMYNALQIPQVENIIQVGIRDYCEAEVNVIKKNEKIKTFFWSDICNDKFHGETWAITCDRIIRELGDKVYISVDIDALDPTLCPNTGTPVPGGMSYDELIYLLERVADAGNDIIGFDLVEVGNDDWDANVGVRLLYKLCACMHYAKENK